MTQDKNRKSRVRADQLLIERGLASDEREAAALIMAGKVVAADQRVAKPGDQLPSWVALRLKNTSKYVSRGGDKLEGAVRDFALEHIFRGKTVLDVGASTGGFSDYALKSGAAHVVAVDVGTNQLAWELRSDSRVSVFEQTDIREFNPSKAPPVDVVVGDISFVALEKIASAIVAAAGDAENFILLVKPQFELAPEFVPSGGVVSDDEDRARAVAAAVVAFEQCGLEFVRSADSRVAGATGNREVFVWFKKKTGLTADPGE